jgi:NAD+ diphosphatase
MPYRRWQNGRMPACPEPYFPPTPVFTGVELDRAAALRHDPEWVAKLLEEPTATAVAANADGVLVEYSDPPAAPGHAAAPGQAAAPGHAAALARRRIAGGGGRLVDPARAILLGIEDGTALFGVDLEDLDPAARSRVLDGAELVSLRDAGAVLAHAEAGLAAYVTALLNWHRRHRFCANCGSPTDIVEGGYSRDCPRCGASHFPRTDPSVIMLVEHDGRVLLGRRVGWPESRYSILAGFVAPGETLEEAVIREVREESGIEAQKPRYVSSQPWPFPSSLMLGFTARSDGGEPRAQDGELEDVRWVTRDEVLAARAGEGELRLPPPISIARFLIDGWIARSTTGG